MGNSTVASELMVIGTHQYLCIFTETHCYRVLLKAFCGIEVEYEEKSSTLVDKDLICLMSSSHILERFTKDRVFCIEMDH